MMKNDERNYEDILYLPYPVSARHPRMSRFARAAQFAPFAALTGHDAAIRETARLTDSKPELDESEKAVLDEKIRILTDKAEELPPATFTYFVADKKKAGGAYVAETGTIQKTDAVENTLLLRSGTVIPIEDICAIDGEMFNGEQ